VDVQGLLVEVPAVPVQFARLFLPRYCLFRLSKADPLQKDIEGVGLMRLDTVVERDHLGTAHHSGLQPEPAPVGSRGLNGPGDGDNVLVAKRTGTRAAGDGEAIWRNLEPLSARQAHEKRGGTEDDAKPGNQVAPVERRASCAEERVGCDERANKCQQEKRQAPIA
jgi:hypothetical protein